MMLRAFTTFSKASGLSANTQKSEIYNCNVEQEVIRRIIEASGFRLGTLLFKYLGVPITSQRLKIDNCEVLTEKIIMNIKTWGSRNMSYAARVVLVNVVLMNLFLLVFHICDSKNSY